MSFFRLIILVCFALGSPTTADAGKASERAERRKVARAEKKRAKEHALLARSAEVYWKGIRWSDTERCVEFIERSDLRMLYQQQLDANAQKHRTVEAKLLHIQVSNERGPNEEKADVLREAIVTIQVEGYTLPEQVLTQKTVTQKWYRTLSGWWLVYDPPLPIGSFENKAPSP